MQLWTVGAISFESSLSYRFHLKIFFDLLSDVFRLLGSATVILIVAKMKTSRPLAVRRNTILASQLTSDAPTTNASREDGIATTITIAAMVRTS